MRNIAVIGAGQAGLQLAIGLRKRGYSVTIFTNKTSEQVVNGNIMSSQGMFNSSLEFERKLGIDFWQEHAPQNNAVNFAIIDPKQNNFVLKWQGKTLHNYQSVDQRIKFSRWMEEFNVLGGKIIIDNVDIKKLDSIAEEYDLTIVATGKYDISHFFPINNALSIFNKPQRALSCIYVKNVIPERCSGVRANIIPGIGEFFTMPGLTLTGCCEMMLFEGIPGADFDCWSNIKNIDDHFSVAIKLLKKFVPDEAIRFKGSEPTDEKAYLTGSYTPVIRNPVLKMPCGKFITGIGDAIVLNDPIAGQGANSAAKAAELYTREIIAHEENDFNEEWMQKIFQESWIQVYKGATDFSNLLLAPPEPHLIELLNFASKSSKISNLLASGFDNPSTLFPWISDKNKIYEMLKSIENAE